MPFEDMRFIYLGQTMEDKKTLESYGLNSQKEGYPIHLVKSLKGDIGEFDSFHANGIYNEALMSG